MEAEAEPAVAADWRRLSPWSIAHFAARAVVENVRAALAFGAGAYGVSRSDFGRLAWLIPAAIAALVLVGSILNYVFYRFRVGEDTIHVRSGALFKSDLNLAFERIQNISLEHPFYFRPLGLVTLRIDGAGAAGEEISLAALDRAEAERLRSFIVGRRRELGAAAGPADAAEGAAGAGGESAAPFFTRSLSDLVVHGLTNGRAFVIVAAAVGFLSQSNLGLEDVVGPLAAELAGVVGSFGLARLALLFVAAFVLVTGMLALLSVVVSIVTYYGFAIYRADGRLTVERGLFTRHEINVRKSRIQTVAFHQDWLDYLLGRRNIVFEQIMHAAPAQQQAASASKRIMVPSVRLDETEALVEEVLPGLRVDRLAYTPIAKRYFYKHALIHSAFHALALLVPPAVLELPPFYVPLVLLLWLPHMALVYLKWKRGGIAIDGDVVAVRSGVVGIEYRAFPAFKLQEIAHLQSVLMRRRDLSTLTFRTAASAISVPYLRTAFARQVVDYCLYGVESGDRTWM